MIYWQLTRFILPLVLTVLVQEFSGQILNGGMARMPQAVETLASYGLAFGLVLFLTSPVIQVKQVGLVLVDSQEARRRVQRFVVAIGLMSWGILWILALTPLGVWVIEDLHSLDAALSATARLALFWLAPVPILRGLTFYYQGILLRFRRSDLVSYAILSSIGVSILAVFGLLPVAFIRQQPILLPILVYYAGNLVELGVTLWGYKRKVGAKLNKTGEPLTLRYVFQFFWPLALIMTIQGFSRPLINLFISRASDGEQALAVLTVVYTLGHLPYGWLNELRSLPVAFKDTKGSLAAIRRFVLACGLLVFAASFVMFWTPVRDVILERWIGLEQNLAKLSTPPLMVFTFFSLVVMMRAYLHGIGLLERRTRVMAPSAPSRILAILVALLIFSLTDVPGATRGVAALLCGFIAETVVVGFGVLGRGLRVKV